MHHSTFVVLAGLAGLVATREFYIFGGNAQACPCIGAGLPCTCTNQAQHGIAPTDDFDCGSLAEKYSQIGAAPAICNADSIDEIELDVMGCRFGEDTLGKILFRPAEFDGFYEVTLPDSDDPNAVVAACSAPDQCVVGDEDSEVFFESKTCLQGIGYETVWDALYRCWDWVEYSSSGQPIGTADPICP